MQRTFRSRLVLASLLWTAGLLLLMHLASMLLLHAIPGMRGIKSPWAIAAGVLSMAAGVVVARRALTPFAVLRRSLAAVRVGRQRRVDGAYPAEVQPLIDELNALLEAREKAVSRAFAAAGDLAHGLKTPLAVLGQEAGRAAAAGNAELGENIAQQVERMSRQVNYQLARARAAASGAKGTAPCAVAECGEALARTLGKLYEGKGLEISLSIGTECAVPVSREDLDEMLGNLLDNACKWARTKVVLRARGEGAMVVVTVDDDGPGLPRELRAAALERGVRLDEAAPGSGLGLAIVRDLAALYGGSISLEDSPLGGLRARVALPV